MIEQTNVIICGGGPTGVLLSALLGKLRVPNILLEREPDITTDPRGIALDEDGIRLLQFIGVYDRLFTEIASPMEKIHFITGEGHDLMKRPLMTMNMSNSDGGTGHVGVICHKQPMLERAIRDVIQTDKHCDLRAGCTVNSIHEDHGKVYVDYVDTKGSKMTIEGSFLVGADGKTGFVRKKYLEPKGIEMNRCEGTAYDETWVALNWKIDLPTEKTHPEFPLWRLGYTPQEVFELFFPLDFRFLCNPYRPAVCGRFGRPQDRLWRFEFVVQKDEDPQGMASVEETGKIIYPFITHPGSRYGISQPVRYPEDCITTLRSRPFWFSARSCNKWALGRVILAGDAAHVFPPFGGQGIASGFRDVSALAWRLALIQRQSKTLDHTEVLIAWYQERKQQLERSLASTVRNGAYVTEANPIKVFIREWLLWAVQLIPAWKHEIEKGPRADGMTRYKYEEGFPFLPNLLGGKSFPQVYAFDLRNNEIVFSDDLVFDKRKQGLFQLVLLPESIDEIHGLLRQTHDLVDDSTRELLIPSEATILIQDLEVKQPAKGILTNINTDIRLSRIASAAEFATLTESLCKNRPAPTKKSYDPFRIKQEVQGRKFIIVRPDFFVYAACETGEELKEAVKQLPRILQLDSDQ